MDSTAVIPARVSVADTAPVIRALCEAVLTMLAALATMGCALAIDPSPGPAMLAVVLCLSLSRSHLDRDLRGRLEAAVALPLVALLAIGAGLLLRHVPWLGAAVFVGGMFVSIWVRRFGPMARRAGSLIALPLVVLLTTPHVPSKHATGVMALLLPVLVALLALFWVSVLHALGRQLRWLPPLKPVATHAAADASATPAPTQKDIAASTRMAVQMAVALGVAFVVGYAFFAERWSWIVLTAFIVNSGNRGRLDVAYKSVLRMLGAAAGTVLALLFTLHLGAHDRSTVVLMLAAVFVGLWLRPLGYAWWALFVTLALALLQGFEGASAQLILWPRLEEIVIGAIIGVPAAWFVLPVRSTDVLRRRMADVLAILADALDPATPARRPSEFIHALEQAQLLAPAFRASRLATRSFRTPQPADWIDVLTDCRDPALALIEHDRAPGKVRMAVGTARKSLREPAELLSALQQLRHALDGAREPASDAA